VEEKRGKVRKQTDVPLQMSRMLNLPVVSLSIVWVFKFEHWVFI
jgi:hypothetical protein